jgi:hypothetical protein
MALTRLLLTTNSSGRGLAIAVLSTVVWASQALRLLKRSSDPRVAGDPLAAEAHAGASQVRANADRTTDEKQKRVDRRG